MKSKGFIVLILLVCFVVTPVFANQFFSVSTGASISYSQDVTSLESLKAFEFNKNNFAIGLELRSNLSFIQLDAVGEISVLDSDTLKLAGILSAGCSVELFDVVKLGLTVGPRIAYIYSNQVNKANTEEETGEEEATISNGKDFVEAIKEGPINIRLMLDIYAGPVITVGFAYTIPTEFSINNGDWEALLPSSSSFEKGKFSLSLLMKLF